MGDDFIYEGEMFAGRVWMYVPPRFFLVSDQPNQGTGCSPSGSVFVDARSPLFFVIHSHACKRTGTGAWCVCIAAIHSKPTC